MSNPSQINPSQIAKTFYEAFSRRDGETMASLYAPKARFTDPVFPDLQGDQIGKMWRALCSRSKDIRIEYQLLETSTIAARVQWDAYYTFTGTGRKVHNRVFATMEIRDGLIVWHRDDFNFWRWSMQALGTPGWLLGWSPLLKNKVRRNAAKLVT